MIGDGGGGSRGSLRYIPPHHPGCFGCGEHNDASLGVRLTPEGERLRGEVTLDARQQGAPGIAHGGAVWTVLDEALGALTVLIRERPMVTVELEATFRRPALLGRRLEIAGWAEASSGRELHVAGELRDRGELIASARGLFLEVDEDHFLRHSGRSIPTWSREGYTASDLERATRR